MTTPTPPTPDRHQARNVEPVDPDVADAMARAWRRLQEPAPMTRDPKPWYASRTVWAGIVTAALGVLGLAGVTLGGPDVAAELADSLAGIGAAVATIVAGVTAIYGRIRAARPIGKPRPPGRLPAIALAATAALAAGGCCANDALTRAADRHAATVLPEYRAYVQADPELEPNEKAVRLLNADSFAAAVAQAAGDRGPQP